jgi:hypothetical protein
MTETPKWTKGPWEYVPGTEHHGPYVTTAADCTYGDIADCYAMSDPSSLSIRNGGTSKPVLLQPENAEANARLIAAAPDLAEVARLVIKLDEATDQAVAQALFEQLTAAARPALSRADGGE